MLHFVRSLACEELAYIFRACLWNLELRIRFDEGIGQLGSKPRVRQIGLQRVKDALSPSKSSDSVFIVMQQRIAVLT